MERSASRSSIRRMYDRIAEHFAETRSHPWEEVTEFVRSVGTAEHALDLGCGNGRHVPALLAIGADVVGLDGSGELLERAKDQHDSGSVSWIQADVVEIPLVDDCMDLALYIATVHHLSSREDRIRSLDELARVLGDGGRGLVSAWSVTHHKFEATAAHDHWVPWTLPTGEVVDRFYHLYDLAEFDADLAESQLIVDRTYESDGNCYGVVTAETS